jgi:hypothetical protein
LVAHQLAIPVHALSFWLETVTGIGDAMSLDCETDLWRAVIQQAITDATLAPSLFTPAEEIAEARNWLTTDNPDKRLVCELAGVCPIRLKESALNLIAKVDSTGATRRTVRKPRAKNSGPYRSNANVQRFTHDGRSLTLVEWEALTGINARTLRSRLSYGWTFEEAITRPVAPKGRGVVADFENRRGDRRGEPRATLNPNRILHHEQADQ